MTATLVFFILLAAISLYSPSIPQTEMGTLGRMIKGKFKYFTSDPSTEETKMGLMMSTTLSEYSISNMDTVFLDVAALERED